MVNYAELGIKAIDENNPAGEDVKYDEDFEKIETEIAKLASPSESNIIDWNLVITLSEDILQNKSKNLFVSVYLCYALLKVEGIDGFAKGVGVLADLLENYWDTLYPPLKRIKGRMNAIEWMLEKVTKEFENSEERIVTQECKEQLLKDLSRVDDFLSKAYEDAPLFYSLMQLVDTKLVYQDVVSDDNRSEQKSSLEETDNEVNEELVQEEETKKPKDVLEEKELLSDTPSIDLDQDKEFQTTVRKLNLFIGKMIESKDYRSELFILNRSLAWLDIDTLPAATNNKTMLPPPDSQEIAILEKLYNSKEYESLLWAAESRITSYLFWLDLHYYVAEALKNLQATIAAESVLREVGYFLKKLPNVEKLTFSDGMAFANKETKKWLKAQTKSSVNLQKEEKNIESVECNQDGMDILAEKIHSAASVEEEVLYTIELCRCLQSTQNRNLILAHTEQLLTKIELYKTSEWKPSIALDAYLSVVGCLESIGEEDTLIEELYQKIALLKPSMVE